VPAASGPLPGTGVTPSAWNTCAERICGAVAHMPPVAPVGSLSTIVAFQASLVPVFCTLRVNCPNCPMFMVAGPPLTRVSAGGVAMVSGGETPCSPGSGKKNLPPRVVPSVQLAVLTNVVPGEFGGTVLLRTTVTSSTTWQPAGMVGKPLNVSRPVLFGAGAVNGTAAPGAGQVDPLQVATLLR